MVVGGAGILLGAGCSSSGGDGFGNGGADGGMNPPPDQYDIADGGGGTGEADGSAPTQRGNPLCHAFNWACYPDGNKGACSLDTDAGMPFTSPSPAPNATMNEQDGGVYAANITACRVRTKDGNPQTVCMQASLAQDGSGCNSGSECGNGYECVPDQGVPGKLGVCRHYCCDGPGACANNRFCDVRAPVEQPQTPIPVCMPVQGCRLLHTPSDCQADETCSIVTDDGVTSCVPIGPRQVGEDCETDHCARGLACLGATGLRTCYQLCEKTGTENQCPPDEKCSGSAPRFKDPNIGYCPYAYR